MNLLTLSPLVSYSSSLTFFSCLALSSLRVFSKSSISFYYSWTNSLLFSIIFLQLEQLCFDFINGSFEFEFLNPLSDDFSEAISVFFVASSPTNLLISTWASRTPAFFPF